MSPKKWSERLHFLTCRRSQLVRLPGLPDRAPTLSAFLQVSCFEDRCQVLSCHRRRLLSTWESVKKTWWTVSKPGVITVFADFKYVNKWILHLFLQCQPWPAGSVCNLTVKHSALHCSVCSLSLEEIPLQCATSAQVLCQSCFVWKSGHKTGSCFQPINPGLKSPFHKDFPDTLF